MSQDVEVRHIAVDELPGGVPMLWEVGPESVTVLMSRAAGVDEIAAAFGPMYRAMAESVVLRAVS